MFCIIMLTSVAAFLRLLTALMTAILVYHVIAGKQKAEVDSEYVLINSLKLLSLFFQSQSHNAVLHDSMKKISHSKPFLCRLPEVIPTVTFN